MVRSSSIYAVTETLVASELYTDYKAVYYWYFQKLQLLITSSIPYKVSYIFD